MQAENGIRRILLLGSGLMAQSVVASLLKRKQNRIHIASNIIQDAKKIADKFNQTNPDFCTHGTVNVTQRQSLLPLVKEAYVVISYVPAFLHLHVAKVCLELKKHLVTASYVSAQMNELNEQAKSNNLIFLNQLGLDPGIDHLATMKIIDEVYSNGGKVIQYESWCGGLPSLAHRNDNPIGYKFTWSPISAFRALKNKATFIDHSKEVELQAKDLLYYGKKIQLSENLELDGYPNRNSVAYKDIYNLKDATKVLRGTLRYPGFCTALNAWKQLGLLNETPINQGCSTWVQYFNIVLKDVQGNDLKVKIKSHCIDQIKHYDKFSEQDKQNMFEHVINTFEFFKLLDPTTKFPDLKLTIIQNLVKHLQPILALKEGQNDLIAMQHIFIIQKNGQKTRRKSSLIKQGEKNGSSAMSLTVGTPTAIGAQLILDGKISQRGVLRPIYPDIYNPVLQQLEKHGIQLIEVDEKI